MRHRADAGIAGCGPALQPESVIADILDREPTVEGLGEQVGDPPLDCSRPRAHLGVIKDRARITLEQGYRLFRFDALSVPINTTYDTRERITALHEVCAQGGVGVDGAVTLLAPDAAVPVAE